MRNKLYTIFKDKNNILSKKKLVNEAKEIDANAIVRATFTKNTKDSRDDLERGSFIVSKKKN